MSQDESVEVEHNYLGSIQLKPRDPQPYYQLSNFDWNFVLDVYTVVLVVLRTCKEYDVTNNVDITKFTENGLTQGKFRYADIPYDFGNDLVYFKVSLSPKNFIYSNLIRITNNDIDKTVRIDYVDNTREGNEEYKQSTRVNLYKHNHVANTEIDAYYQISTEQNVNSRIQENSLQEWYMPPINAWTFKRIEKAFYNGGFWLDLVRNYLTSPLEYVERQELSNVSEQMFTTDPNEDDILNVIEVEIESNPIPMLSSTSVKSSTSHLSSEVLTYGDDVEAFTYRVESDGGTVESPECIGDLDSLLVMYPSGYKATVLYSQVTNDGLNDWLVDRLSNKTRINESLLIETLADNVPSLDYSGGGCPVLLNEPQSTNIIPYSEDFSSGWSKIDCSVSLVPGILDPAGNNDAMEQIEGLGASTKLLRYPLTVTNQADISFSIYVKKKNAKYCRILDNKTLQGFYFNFDTGLAENAQGGATPIITEFPNGWYKIGVDGGQVPSTSAEFRLYNIADNGDFIYAGDGVSGFYLFGAMLEESMESTSYIKTNGASATRLKDDITITVPLGANFVIETINGVEQAPQSVVPSTTYTIPNGKINSIKMTS